MEWYVTGDEEMGENIQPIKMKERSIQLGYVAGLSLILAAIIYFFAANWAGFDKWEKIGLSIGLLLLFYGSSFISAKAFQRRPFVSELFLFFGCMTFGVGAALLGQIYNSHADSFMLFAVWAIPALLFSFITNYQPFYMLTYGLIHLSAWLFLFPSSGFHMADEYWYRSFFIGVALVNILLFGLIEKQVFRSRALSLLAFIVFHVMMLVLSTGEWFEFFSSIMSIIYMAVLACWFWYDLKTGGQKASTLLLGLAMTVFFIIKFITFLIFVGSEYVFLLTFFFPIMLVGAAVWILSKSGGRLKGNSWFKRIFIGIIAGIGSVMGASSIAGILFLIIGEVPFYVMMILAVFTLITPAVVKPKWDAVIRHTLLLTGYLIGIPSAIVSHMSFSILFIGVLGAVFFLYSSKSMRYVTYFAAMMTLFSSLLEEGMTMEATTFLLLILNMILFVISRFSQREWGNAVYHNSCVYGFLAFFVLTFLHENAPVIYYTVNALYFVLTTFVLFYALKKHWAFEYRVGLVFWFAYVVYKYYDLLWSLLHKSITFLVIGFLLLSVTKWYDRFLANENTSVSFVRRKWLSVLTVIVLQLAIIGVQVGKSEALLAEGETVRLELRPVDPRSLLQGDYVILRYSISSLELKPEPNMNEKVSVGLVQNENGIYEYSGSFVKGRAEEASLGKADVWITGRYKGDGQIEYGIENYFVSEGTGRELEGKAKYANVKVSESGDAILLSLE